MDGGDAASNSGSQDSASFCADGSLDPTKVKGRLVLCKMMTPGSDSVVKLLGADGTIIQNDQFVDRSPIFMASATMVSSFVGASVESYIKSTRYQFGFYFRFIKSLKNVCIGTRF